MSTIVSMQQSGAPSVLQPASASVGAPGPGQVRLRQEAVGVNFVDTMVRRGSYPVPLPAVPGFEAAGVITAVGSGTRLRVGQRVAYYFAAGAYASERLVEASALLPLPDDIGTERAAAFLAKGLTAWMGLRSLYRLRPGETILVQGASGSVGAILTRWARALGATVIGVAGSGAKLDRVRQGAHHALAADDPQVLDKLRAIAPGGVDVVVDFVGQAVAGLTLAALRDGGTVVAIGAASGQARFDPALLARRGIAVRSGATPQHVTGDKLEEAARELFRAMRDGLFDDVPVVAYPLVQAAQVHDAVERRTLEGLAILVP